MKQHYDNLIAAFTQPIGLESGGINNPPETKLLMCCLIKLIDAKNVLELGYDAGYTTEALACTGVNITGVDNFSEYTDVKPNAAERLSKYPNVTLVMRDALEYLREQEDSAFDFIFVDDSHDLEHVQFETVELRRVVSPDGIVVFHNSNINGISEMVARELSDWQRMLLPAASPLNGVDYGIYVVRKPS